ncbi:MAG: hypothetical protein ACFFFC_00190 [Candidatus Thorarchaeota archaeon]
MLRYGNRRFDKPNCYGKENYFNENDSDCERCDWCEDCENAVRSKRYGTSIPVNTIRNKEGPTEVFGSSTEAGIIREGETAGQRFVKDCLTGACRGIAWEAYRFFWKFRF